MYESILVPLDGSALAQSIIPLVRDLAKGLGSRVILLHVLEAVADHPDGDVQLYEREALEKLHPMAIRYLKDMAAPLGQRGVMVETAILEGKPYQEIVEFAEGQGIGLIAMATHGRSGIVRAVLGSVATRVLQASPCPLLLAKPQQEGSLWVIPSNIKTILVPLDGSDLAEAVLPHAEELARRLDLEMWLIQVLPPEEPVVLGPYTSEFWRPAKVEVQRLDSLASGYLAGLGMSLRQRGVRANWEVLHGNAAESIIEFGRDRPNVMIAMATHGRSGLQRWLLGSVADAVIREAGVPVLVVKPQGTRG